MLGLEAVKRKFCLLIKCACGCGEFLKDNPNDRHRNRGRYVSIKHFCRAKNWYGSNHPSWRGGKKIERGYVYIHKPEHRRSRSNYVPEQILIYEQYHKCCLLDWGIVHHINKIRSDNRIQNLLGVTKQVHANIHMKERRDPKTGRVT